MSIITLCILMAISQVVIPFWLTQQKLLKVKLFSSFQEQSTEWKVVCEGSTAIFDGLKSKNDDESVRKWGLWGCRIYSSDDIRRIRNLIGSNRTGDINFTVLRQRNIN